MPSDTKIQDPQDKLDYVVNWQDGTQPGLATGETIDTSVWSVYDAKWETTTHLVMHPELEANDDTTATGWVSVAAEAVPNAKYYFTNHIVTDQGRELSWSIPIKIKEQ